MGQGPSALFHLAEMNHGVVELLVRHWRLGERMGPLSPVGVEHEIEVTPPGVGRRGASGVDDPAVQFEDQSLCSFKTRAHPWNAEPALATQPARKARALLRHCSKPAFTQVRGLLRLTARYHRRPLLTALTGTRRARRAGPRRLSSSHATHS